MAHFHLAWELGAGQGQLGRLRLIAQALMARGHGVSMSLRDLEQCFPVLQDMHVLKLQAPVWQHATAGLPPNPGNLAEILLAAGYLEAGGLAGLVDGWRHALRLVKPDLVVADFAPSAIIAARTLGLRSVALANGIACPPAGQPLPALRPLEHIPRERLVHAEQRVLAVVNSVAAHFGSPPYACAADFLTGDWQSTAAWPGPDQSQAASGGADQALLTAAAALASELERIAAAPAPAP